MTDETSTNHFTLSKLKSADSGEVEIVLSLIIRYDFSWRIPIDELTLFPSDVTTTIFSSVPKTASCILDVAAIIQLLEQCYPCKGNRDEKYQCLKDHRKGNFNLKGIYYLHFISNFSNFFLYRNTL